SVRPIVVVVVTAIAVTIGAVRVFAGGEREARCGRDQNWREDFHGMQSPKLERGRRGCAASPSEGVHLRLRTRPQRADSALDAWATLHPHLTELTSPDPAS